MGIIDDWGEWEEVESIAKEISQAKRKQDKPLVQIFASRDLSATDATILNTYPFDSIYPATLYAVKKLDDVFSDLGINKQDIITLASDNDYDSFIQLSENTMMVVKHSELSINFTLYSKQLKTLEKWNNLLVEIVEKHNNQEKKNTIDFYTCSLDIRGNLQIQRTKTYEIEDLDYLDPAYFEEQLNPDEMYRQFTNAQEGILALFGEPGVGKSKLAAYYMKWMLNNMDKVKTRSNYLANTASVWLVKNSEVMANEEFWSRLGYDEPAAVLMDDLDYVLDKREKSVSSHLEQSQNNTMSMWLTYVDGIEKHNTKFIVTTNSPSMRFDPAILRKGRAWACFALRPLSVKQAKKIWSKAEIADIPFPFADKENVSQAELGSKIYEIQNQGEKYEERSFFKDPEEEQFQIEERSAGFRT